jgi:hypothetical protein
MGGGGGNNFCPPLAPPLINKVSEILFWPAVLLIRNCNWNIIEGLPVNKDYMTLSMFARSFIQYFNNAVM